MSAYELASPISSTVASALEAYHPLVRQLLHNRGVTTSEAAKAWLEPEYDSVLNDPFLLNDMEVAVERILRAITNNEQVVIYSDYDCDGIPGAVVLHDFFTEVGFSNFSVYIPHRHYEGFGFNEEAAEKLAKSGAELIITIDCGTGDAAAVAAANRHGVDVIVTDHHQATGALPAAVAVVNPAISPEYPFPYLCGAGVIFKVVQALLARGEFSVISGREKWWLDMVGLATVSDMVSLTGENRSLAHYGLHVLRKSRRLGLRALLKKQRANQATLTEDDIGFTIGPRINAASRMGEPLRAFKLLTATTVTEAAEHLDHLEQLNNERKGAVAAMTRAAHKKIAQLAAVPPVLVIGDPEWRPSLVGLVANKLAEEHNVPAFVWGRDGNDVIKGSCRGNGEVSVLALMEAATEHFSEYGGHHQSGGFSVHEPSIHTLQSALSTAHDSVATTQSTIPSTVIDISMPAAEFRLQDVQPLLTVGPFGVDNPKPLVQLIDVRLQSVEIFGKGNEHTKLVVPIKGGTIEGIAFFRQPEQFSATPTTEEICVVVAQPEVSFFMGRRQTRLRIVDVLAEPVT